MTKTMLFTQADVSLLADIADGFSTVLHYDRLDDLRKRLRDVVEAPAASPLREILAITEPLALLLAIDETTPTAEILSELQRVNRLMVESRAQSGEPVAWLIVREDGSVCDEALKGSRAFAEDVAKRYAQNSGCGPYTVEPLYRAGVPLKGKD